VERLLRLLQIEDSESDAELLRRLVEHAGFRVEESRVECAEQLRAALATADWDIVVCDYNLPGFDARSALHILQESGCDIPFIVVSGNLGEELAVEMMRLGAQDYVMKDKLARFIPAMERELKEARLRAEQRVIEAAREQADAERERLRAQFLEAQKMESIGRLAGRVAHDFNNLLTVINGYSQLALLQLKEDDPMRASLEAIDRAGQRAVALVQQLLALGRRRARQTALVNLNAVAGEILHVMEPLMAANVEVTTRFDDCLPNVVVDRHQIEEILMNLVVNARDAMTEGGRLTIQTCVVDDGRLVRLSVCDTGTGMDDEVRGRLFQPFFTTKEEGKGTGLGLATVRTLVEENGGRISFDSEPGKGSVFHASFPVAGV